MKRMSTTLALLALLGSGAVMAQHAPPPPEQPSTMGPSTSTTSPGYSQSQSSSSTSSASEKSDKKAEMKNCIAQERAKNSQLSEHEAKKACKASMSSGSHEAK